MKQFLLLAAVAVIVAVGFVVLRDNRSAVNDVRNASYEIDGIWVTLGTAPGDLTYFGNAVSGDFNGDDLADQAFVLVRSPGGSGTFYYVAVALGTDRGYVGTNALFLGDRIAPQTTEFRDGRIIVNYADRKPTEPMTVQPSWGVSRFFQVQDDRLVEVAR